MFLAPIGQTMLSGSRLFLFFFFFPFFGKRMFEFGMLLSHNVSFQWFVLKATQFSVV